MKYLFFSPLNLNHSIKRKVPVFAYWLPCIIFFIYYLYKSYHHPPHDFSNSYFPAYFFLKGELGNWIFDPYDFNRKIFEEGFKNVYASFNPNPPFVTIFYSPFALMSLPAAKLTFNILSSLLFLFSAYRLCKYTNQNITFIFALLPVIFFLPISNQILFGQTYFLLFFLLTEGFLANVSRNHWLTGILWTLAIFLKVFPVILFLYLLLRKDWRAIAWLAGCCLFLLIFSVTLLGIPLWKEYLFTILPAHSNGEINAAFTYNYQSIYMLAKYAFIKDPVLNRHLLLNSPLLYSFLLIFFKSMALGICASVIMSNKNNELLSFGLLLLGSILISPFGSTYSNLLLLILMMGAWQSFPSHKTLIIISIIFLAGNLPVSLFTTLPIILRFPRLFLLTALLITVFIFNRTKLDIRITAAFIVIYALSFVFKWDSKIIGPDRHFLPDEEQLIVFDYTVRDGRLFYDYWSATGSTEADAGYAVHSINQTDVTLSNNQILYKEKQVTFTNDNKSKPVVLNGNIILYLSDKGKGFHFYTLRYIPLDKTPFKK